MKICRYDINRCHAVNNVILSMLCSLFHIVQKVLSQLTASQGVKECRLNLLPLLSESLIFLELLMVDKAKAKKIRDTFMLTLLVSGLD